MRRTSALVATITVLGLLGGCVQPAVSLSPSPSASALSVDLTAPGQARTMVRKLIAKAGTPDLIQVEISQLWAAITVVKNGQPESWAWRDDTIKQVDTDVVNAAALLVAGSIVAGSELTVDNVPLDGRGADHRGHGRVD